MNIIQVTVLICSIHSSKLITLPVSHSSEHTTFQGWGGGADVAHDALIMQNIQICVVGRLLTFLHNLQVLLTVGW